MNRSLTIGVILAGFALSAAAQDWYNERDQRYRGEEWRPHIFMQVRTDLEHVWSDRAHDREQERLAKTEGELTTMQADLDQGRSARLAVRTLSFGVGVPERLDQPASRGLVHELQDLDGEVCGCMGCEVTNLTHDLETLTRAALADARRHRDLGSVHLFGAARLRRGKAR